MPIRLPRGIRLRPGGARDAHGQPVAAVGQPVAGVGNWRSGGRRADHGRLMRSDHEAASPATDDTPEQAVFRARVRAWFDENATPRADDDLWEVTGFVSPDRAGTEFEEGRRWQRRLHEAGWAGIAWPAEYGGGGGEPWMARIVNEVARDYRESSGFIASTIAMLGPTLLRHGTEEQKRHFLPRLLSAEYTFCQLFSEPGAGSDLAALATRAVRDGDEFVVDGQKVWNSAAQFCDWGFLLVRTNPDVPKHRGITFLLVDMSTPGIEVRPLVQMTGSAHFNEVFLSGVRIPVANVVGEIDGGWGPARTVLANESAFIGRGTRPTSTRLVELARLHRRERDPLVRAGIVDLWTRERLQTLMGETIQNAVRAGKPPPIDGALIKLYAAESKRRAGDLAVGIMGAAATAGDTDPARWARAELYGRFSISIGGGTNEVQRNNLAERALGLPREPRVDKDIPWREVPRS
ncbi:MAG: dehydrogenase [Actinomyces sp.]|nr:MAG: dehydrogenase [Actinomyces sp.]